MSFSISASTSLAYNGMVKPLSIMLDKGPGEPISMSYAKHPL